MNSLFNERAQGEEVVMAGTILTSSVVINSLFYYMYRPAITICIPCES